MNDREKMDERDDWLLNLYDGTGEVRPPADPELAREAASLREMKSILDARPQSRPDARTVSAVLAAARTESIPRGARRDRAPARRQRTAGLRVGAATAVVVVLIALVGIFQVNVWTPDASPAPSEVLDAPASETGRTGSAADADLHPESARRTPPLQVRTPDVRVRADAVADSAAGFALANSRSNSVLTWDERREVIELHQRLERIGTGVDRNWGPPPVPLESLPAGPGTGILPVGQQR